jgi:hypothetical protein
LCKKILARAFAHRERYRRKILRIMCALFIFGSALCAKLHSAKSPYFTAAFAIPRMTRKRRCNCIRAIDRHRAR